MSIANVLNELRQTNVTPTIHRTPYDAISPTRPELSQAGRVVLITGGATGVGFAMARAFIQASTSTIIIVGRRKHVLEAAQAKLEAEAKTKEQQTNIITRQCDVSNLSDISTLWKDLAGEEIGVDVYVANAAAFSEPVGMVALGTKKMWEMMETNVKGPIEMAERFVKQLDTNRRQKFIINVTTANIHATHHPVVAGLPSYTLSKFSGTLFFQYLAQEIACDEVQILSFHPGLIFNEYWASKGVDKECFDDDRLTGSFAVWAASKEAAFLHGRTVWCSWDVEELAKGELRKHLEEDFYFLRGSISGLNGGNLA